MRPFSPATRRRPAAPDAASGPARSTTPPGTIGWIGGSLVAAFVLLGLAGPFLTPYHPTELAGVPLAAPGREHLLGTNSVGQDVLAQLIAGTGVSLTVALLAGVGTIAIGALVGLTAGWHGGRVDAVLMRVVDLFLMTPRLPLLIVIGAYVGPSLPVISLIIAITFWPMSARVVRSQVLSLRQRAHVRAAVGFGARSTHVLGRHILPEVSLILAAALVSAAGRAVTLEAGLAFLGLGDPSRVSWGRMLRDAMDFAALLQTDAWQWWLLPPIVAIALLLTGITFVGVAVEQRINPRLVRHRGGRR